MADYSLSDTIALMTSDDYKDRFKAEYFQTKNRCEKLDIMIDHMIDGSLDFQPKCPIYILIKQLETMSEYLDILTARAQIEGIDLTWQG